MVKAKELLKMLLQYFVSFGKPVLYGSLLFDVFMTCCPRLGAEFRFEGMKVDCVLVDLGEQIFDIWVAREDKVSLLSLLKKVYVAPRSDRASLCDLGEKASDLLVYRVTTVEQLMLESVPIGDPLPPRNNRDCDSDTYGSDCGCSFSV